MPTIAFRLNGRDVTVENPSPQKPLLDFIREQGLTGAKEGCAEGECGACAVALVERDDLNPHQSRHQVVNSCLMFLPMAAGREVLTVEALAAGGELSAVQRAMARGGASQCGYCTPGFVVSLFAEYHRRDRVGPCDTAALTGNLCRCTGYRPIADAARSLGGPAEDEFSRRLSVPSPALGPIQMPGFSRPTRLAECLGLLREAPGARVVAGATDLAVEANLRVKSWPHLVSVESIDELRVFENSHERVLIGAALPLAEISRRWPGAPQAVEEWLTVFASPLIRNRATIGGNLATASPIGDAAPLLLALDAVVHVASEDGRRAVPLASFFTGYRTTVLGEGELIVAVEIPKPLPAFLRFYKVSKRRLDDISTVAAGMSIDLDDRHRVLRARIAFGGVAATPIRALEAENAITGARWDSATIQRVHEILDRTLNPMSDHRGSRAYRLAMTKSLVEKYFWECGL